jgi:hypothetical protein
LPFAVRVVSYLDGRSRLFLTAAPICPLVGQTGKVIMNARTAALGVTLALCILAAPLAAKAQQPAKAYRIGALGAVPPKTPEFERLLGPFREGMRERGYVEGQGFVIEYGWTGGRPSDPHTSRPSLWVSRLTSSLPWVTQDPVQPKKPPARSPSSWCMSSTLLRKALSPASHSQGATSRG